MRSPDFAAGPLELFGWTAHGMAERGPEAADFHGSSAAECEECAN
jgi:hypothetical protein